MDNNAKEKEKGVKDLLKLLTKNDLKEKDAVCLDKRISYCRGDHLSTILSENSEKIPESLKKFLIEDIGEKFDHIDVLQWLLDNRYLIRLEREPSDAKKYKWPKKLNPSRELRFDEKTFYTWNVAVSKRWKYTLMITVLVIVFGIFLFPLWPMSAKLIVFYVSVIILYFLLGIIFVRLIFYIVLRILGFEFWIFPNLFQDVSVIDSFKPFCCFNRCKDDWNGLGIRIVGLVILSLFIYKLGQEPETLREFKDIGTQSFDDIIEWGTLRLEGKGDIPLKRSLPSIHDLLNETTWENETNITNSSNSEL